MSSLASWFDEKLSNDIECVQKRCLKLLFLALSYTESLSKRGLERLDVRSDMMHRACLDRSETSFTLYVTSC